MSPIKVIVSRQTLSRLLALEWRAGVAVAERSKLRKEILALGLAMSASRWPDGRSGH
ncbi:hypothetical protein ACKJSM_21240 [Pseudomonas sp. PHC1]|uniref:hypothetical protein n=1 Tax=Pseudomonas sp. PHC1 TaxID=3384759 RepID=UPI00396F6CF7